MHEPDPNYTRRQTLGLTAQADEGAATSWTPSKRCDSKASSSDQFVAESSIPKSGQRLIRDLQW